MGNVYTENLDVRAGDELDPSLDKTRTWMNQRIDQENEEMSKRKQAQHRTPGTLGPFTRGDDAAERLAVLDMITDRFAGWERNEHGQHNRQEVEEGRVAPLEELSAIIGVQFADVRRGAVMRHRSGVRGLHQPLAWQFVAVSGVRSPCFTRDDLRREDRLNEVAFHWGRPLSAPRLTVRDGRTIIRLLHEHIEGRARSEENES